MQWKRGKARDPVCGMYVDPKVALTRTIQGVTYYFCEEECAERFEKQTSPRVFTAPGRNGASGLEA